MKSKMYTGMQGGVYGLKSIASQRGLLDKNRYRSTNLQNILGTINSIQKQEFNSKSFVELKREDRSTAELVYGLNMSIPAKKTIPEQINEDRLRRHLVKTETEKLGKKIQSFTSAKQSGMLKDKSDHELKGIICDYFDAIEKRADKGSRDVIRSKLTEVINDHEGLYLRKNLENVQAADARIKQMKREAAKRKEVQKELTMRAIYECTPHAYEACRFDRIMNPKKWANM